METKRIDEVFDENVKVVDGDDVLDIAMIKNYVKFNIIEVVDYQNELLTQNDLIYYAVDYAKDFKEATGRRLRVFDTSLIAKKEG